MSTRSTRTVRVAGETLEAIDECREQLRRYGLHRVPEPYRTAMEAATLDRASYTDAVIRGGVQMLLDKLKGEP